MNNQILDINKLENLYQLFERGTQIAGEGHPLYRFNRTNNKEESMVTVTYDEYLPFLQKMILAYQKLIKKGDKVVLIGETSVQWITTYMATVCAGGIIVPLDPGILDDEVINFTNLAEAKMVVSSKTWDKKHILVDRENEFKTVEHFVELDKSTFTTTSNETFVEGKNMTFNNILALGESEYAKIGGEFVLPEQNTEEMSVLLFTSGTTGTSKGVMLCQRNICAVMIGIDPVLNVLDKYDSVLSVLPIHHTYEMSAGVLAPMIYGMTINISDGIKYVQPNAKQFKPSVLTLVPLFVSTLHKKIWKNIEKQGKDKLVKTMSKVFKHAPTSVRRKIFKSVLEALGGNVKYFIVGGAPLNPDIADDFKTFGIHISQGYGITECAPLISVVSLKVYKPASCGKLMPGLEIKFDKEREDETYGEVVVRGKNVMLGYYKMPEITKDVLSEDGWFRTGDYGYMDENGYLYLTGRKKNIIIASNGKNVFPEEIEEYIETIKYVEEVVVVGREHKETGAVDIVAIVVPNKEECDADQLTDDEIIYDAIYHRIMDINKNLEIFKHVSHVEIRKEPFEKTPSKKIKRYLVK